MSSSLRPLLVLALAPLLALTACSKKEPAATASSASTTTAATADLPIIGPAPAWSLTSLDGQPIGRDTLKGKVVVIDFWATWCGPCVHEIPGYVALQKKYADRGLVIVGLSVDQNGAAVVPPFAKKMSVNYPLALSTTELTEAFGGIEAIPTTLLIDREGNIRHRKVGSMDTGAYEKLILSVL
jgi:thiol-disulfide isomerase/thioredoxin